MLFLDLNALTLIVLFHKYLSFSYKILIFPPLLPSPFPKNTF